MNANFLICRRQGDESQTKKEIETPHGVSYLVLFALLLFVGNLFAADVVTDFSGANKLYAEGKFSDAATAYEKILLADAQSPALFFNVGNAEFKAGHLGKAIAAFQKAAQLKPRDSEIRANLAFARNQVQGASLRESRWQNSWRFFSLNEITQLTAGFFWLTFLLFIARQIKPTLIPKLKNVTWLLLTLTIFSAALLSLQAVNHFFNANAIVTADNVIVRSGPFDDAQSAFTVRDGAELSVLDRRDSWIQVVNRSGKTGWLSVKQAEVLPGA